MSCSIAREDLKKHDVGPDEDVVAYLGAALVLAVVVAGNGAATYVDPRAEAGVAEVGEVRDLGARSDLGTLELDVCACFGPVMEVGAAAQVGTRSAADVVSSPLARK